MVLIFFFFDKVILVEGIGVNCVLFGFDKIVFGFGFCCINKFFFLLLLFVIFVLYEEEVVVIFLLVFILFVVSFIVKILVVVVILDLFENSGLFLVGGNIVVCVGVVCGER